MPNNISAEAQGLIQMMRGGSYSLARDVLKHRVWDSRYFPNTTISDATFFTQPQNSQWKAGAGLKTPTETNMIVGSQLPNGQVFVAVRMGVSFCSMSVPATVNAGDLVQSFYNIMQNSVFEVKIQGREWDYQIHGTEFLPMPVAISGESTVVTAVGAQTRIGDNIASGWSKLDPTPIVIDNQVTFSVSQKITNADTAVMALLNADSSLLFAAKSSLMVILEGLLTKAK